MNDTIGILLDNLDNDLAGVAFIAVAFLYMYLAKLISDRIAGFEPDREIEERSNLAVALRRGGFYLAIPLGMFGAILGPGQGLASDLQVLALDGLLITLFMFVARQINDRITLRGLDNNQAVLSGNRAVGWAECGGYLATGIIAMASFYGEGDNGIVSAVVFFLLGQVMLLLVTRLYEMITPWSVVQAIDEGKTSAGLMVGGTMVAMAVILAGPIMGPGSGWQADLLGFAWYSVMGIVLMLLANPLIDRLFLPNTDIRTEIERDDNVAAIAVVVCVKIAMALMIHAAVVG